MAHYFLSVALVDLLAAAGDAIMPDGTKGKDHGRGVVVVTSSIASLHNATNVDMTSYATTKAATDHLVALLASKFARWYVRVCGINPGCKFSAILLAFLTTSSRPKQYESNGNRCRSRYFW